MDIHHLAGDVYITEKGKLPPLIDCFTINCRAADDLCDLGETCCPNRVAQLAKLAGIYAQIGYKRRPGKYGGKPSIVVDNTLDRQFNVDAPNRVWVTDITYITYIKTPSRACKHALTGSARRVLVSGCCDRSLLSPRCGAPLVHCFAISCRAVDQGSQFTSIDWASFLNHHNLEHSMSRRGNCDDNAVAESFFNLLKRERIWRRTYKTREDARSDIFDDIEMFYNPKRKHARNGMLSPAAFERLQQRKLQGV